MNMKVYVRRRAALVFAVFCVLVLVFNLHIIPTGYTGVKTSFGQIQEEPVQSGKLIFTVPFVESIQRVNNKQQDFKVTEQIWGETCDKTPVYAREVIVTYQIAADRSAWIYANVSDYTKNLITDSLVASAVKSAMVELAPGDVTNRGKIEPLVQEKLTQSLAAKYGEGTIYVNKVIINDMDFEAAYNDAIQAKSIAAQEQAKAEIVNQTAIARAEADKQVAVKKAEAEADVMRIASEAEAEKMRIAAEAEAEANRKLSESLTDELIELKKVEAWDGRLPSVYGGNALLELGIDTAE